MEKVQKLAVIDAIETNDALDEQNDANGTFRVIASFHYVDEDSDDDDIQALFESLSHTTTRTLILDLATFATDEKTLAKRLKVAQETFVEKKVICTTYTANISELNDDGHKSVFNTDNGREYSSFSKSYAGKYNDAENALASMRRKLESGLEDEIYSWKKPK